MPLPPRSDVIFGIRPDLDLKLAALFFDPERGGFWRAYDPPFLRARDAATWLVTLVAMPAFVALAVKLIRPAGRCSSRAARSC